MKRRSVFLTVVGCVAFGATAMAQSNTVSNFSFEAADPTNGSLAANWQTYGGAYTRAAVAGVWDGTYVAQVTSGAGAVQRITLNQSWASPVRISVRMKGSNIVDDPADKIGASLDCKIYYRDGSNVWCPTTLKTKSVGTFDWKWVGYNTGTFANAGVPIDAIEVRVRMGAVAGTAWFDDVHVEQWTPKTGGLVSFVFDDSFLSTYTKAYPMLKAAGFVGTSAAVTSYLGADSIHMTWAQLQELYNNGWSVASHTATHKDLTTLSLTELNNELYWSHKALVDAGFPVQHIMLPFGAYNAGVITRVQMERYGGYAYKSMRTSDSGINPQGLFPYNTFSKEIDSNTTPATAQSWINEAKARGGWVVLMLHEVDSTTNGVYTVSSSTLQAIVNAVKSSGLPVVTYDEGFRRMTQ